jgi:putative ABC transport system permease protein
MKLLSLSFLKMVLVAACVGVPMANYLVNSWLRGFEFRTTLSMSIVLVSVAGTAIIAFLTISVQAYKSATSNPVEALK